MIYFFIDLLIAFLKNCTKGKYYSLFNKILMISELFGDFLD